MYSIELQEEMRNLRQEFLNKLSKIVHPSYVEQFAKILHYSWQENLQEAETIADDMNIFPIDFVAFAENEEEFKELFLKEKEELLYG